MYKLITFDMYSATMDINGSAVPMVKKILQVDEEIARSFFTMWRAQQWNYLLLNNSMENGYINYEEITRIVLEYTEKKFKILLSSKQKEELMKIWTSFNPWNEAKDVLKELKRRGYKIGMLSNGDTKMLAPLATQCDIEFDYIFSAQDAQKYKPHPDVYDAALKKSGYDKKEILHVAGSVFDLMGTRAAGFDCAWTNRYADYVLNTEFEPNYNMKNLNDLLEIL